MKRFHDRADAGRRLAERLTEFAAHPEVLVLALPRGGVPVAAEVARQLRAPLDILVVRKLGLPGNEEYAMGAIASGGAQVLNPHAIERYGLRPADVAAVVRRETAELRRRESAYRGNRPFPALAGRTLLLVDDGIATGATMLAAVAAVASAKPARVIVATPVLASTAAEALEAEADGVVCVLRPEDFSSVGEWYEDFSQTSDDTVVRLLAAHHRDYPLVDLNR
jgi:putative phosphoribosyl transferase